MAGASTLLSDRVIGLLTDPQRWEVLPAPVRDWLELQRHYAELPKPGRLLVETFPRDERHYTVIYAFAGKNANQTLGLLISQRMEDAGLAPVGFLSTDYAVMIWGLREVTDPAPLLKAQPPSQGSTR